MQLVLSIGSKVLDRVDIKPELAFDEEYLDSLRIAMLVKNELTLLAFLQEPSFYIEVSSRMGAS